MCWPVGQGPEGLDAPRVLEQVLPDEIGLGLMKHALTEFTYLSRFLPSLYIAENREKITPPNPS